MMFRSKKGASQVDKPASVAETPEALPQAEMPAPVPRKNIPFPTRPIGHAGYPFEIPRRTDLAPVPVRNEASAAPASKDKTMAVGRDVELRGEISACDRLIVDGTVELKLTGGRMLQIGNTGLFTGTAEVAEAEISGRFEGDLTVPERLTIRAGGQVRGRIRYGQIVIEAGGELTGDVATWDGQRSVTLTDGGMRLVAPGGGNGAGRLDVLTASGTDAEAKLVASTDG
jgi:cytoskeletal protein CcmA (bactofilin family)